MLSLIKDNVLWIVSMEFLVPSELRALRGNSTAPKLNHAKPEDLLMMPILGVFLLFLRILFENTVASALIQRWAIKNRRKNLKEIPELEELYLQYKSTPPEAEVTKMSKKLDLTSNFIADWLRKRKSKAGVNVVKKFKEESWRCVFYIFLWVYGLWALWPMPWFMNIDRCWDNFPFQEIPLTIYWYYMLEGGFYVSLLCTVLYDTKRKDFYAHVIHHIATLLLITCSYSANCFRGGALVMVVHDVADIPLELAKCAMYAKRKQLADTFFNVFGAVFIITRLAVFPLSIVIPSMQARLYPAFYFFNALLFTLQSLNVFWSWTIIRMAYRIFVDKDIKKDIRSEDEYDSDDDDDL